MTEFQAPPGALPNVAATAPAKIYLVIGEDCPPEEDFKRLASAAGEDLTWCEDKIDDNSIEYVRADLAAAAAVMPNALRVALEDLDAMESLGPTTEAVIDAAQRWYLAAAPAPVPVPDALRVALENLDATEPLGPTTEAVIDAAQRWYLASKVPTLAELRQRFTGIPDHSGKGAAVPAPAEGDELPELPKPYQYAIIATAKNTPAVRAGFEEAGYEKTPNLYTAEQMQDYARAARSNPQPKGTGRDADSHAGQLEQAYRAAMGDRAFSQAPAPAGAADDGSTPGEWFVRKRERDGELLDCFVAAPDCQGMPYDAEILGDDEYREEAGGVARKLADCELIVKAVKAYRAGGQAPAVGARVMWQNRVRLRGVEGAEFGEWHECSEAVAAACPSWTHPKWEYESRVLIAVPATEPYLKPAQKDRYKFMSNVGERIKYEAWQVAEGNPVRLEGDGTYSGHLTAQHDWYVWQAATVSHVPVQGGKS